MHIFSCPFVKGKRRQRSESLTENLLHSAEGLAQPAQETQILYVDLDNRIAYPYDPFPPALQPPGSADASSPTAAAGASGAGPRSMVRRAAGVLPQLGNGRRRQQERQQERLRRALRGADGERPEGAAAEDADDAKDAGVLDRPCCCD
jgi:hypothetical protein